MGVGSIGTSNELPYARCIANTDPKFHMLLLNAHALAPKALSGQTNMYLSKLLLVAAVIKI